MNSGDDAQGDPCAHPVQTPANANGWNCSAICLITTLVITNRVKSEFVSPWMIVVFSVFFPFYLVLTAVIGLYGHARQISKYSSWNPTART